MMSLSVDLSVIIPLYNAEKYIVRCINSLLNQSGHTLSYEVIVVDDGSLDAGSEIVRKICEISGKVTLISKPNGGVSSARNYGIKASNGKYLGFVDSDDWIEDGYFHELDSILKSSVVPDCIVFPYYEDNGLLAKIITSALYDCRVTESQFYLHHILAGNIVNSVCNKIILRAAFDTQVFPEGIIVGEDALVSVVLGKWCESFLFSSNAYLHYMQNTNGVTKRCFSTKHYLDAEYVLKEIFNIISNKVEMDEYLFYAVRQLTPYWLSILDSFQDEDVVSDNYYRFCLVNLKLSGIPGAKWKLYVLMLKPFVGSRVTWRMLVSLVAFIHRISVHRRIMA